MTEHQHPPLPPDALDDWATAVCAALDIDRATVDIALILDLARDVAHGVARPAAPLSAFLVGLAAGRAAAQHDDAVAAVDTVTRLAKDWPAR